MRGFDDDWVPEECHLWDDIPDAYYEFLGYPSRRNPLKRVLWDTPLISLAIWYERRLTVDGYIPRKLNRMQRWLLDKVPF